MLADARLFDHKPASLSKRGAAALSLAAITAFEGLQRAGLKAGQTFLLFGGAGGVGHVVPQPAKHDGAEDFATVGGDPQAEIVEGYGATAINYRTENVADYVAQHTGGAGFDVVFNSVGGANMANSFEAAALNGQIASTVSMLELDLTPVHFKGLSLHVVFMLIPMLHYHQRETHGAILNRIADIVDAGALRPLLDAPRFGLGEVGAAYDRLAGGQAIGKVVVEL